MLSDNSSELYQSFWQFSLQVYKQPEVAQLLIESQDEIGSNVNLVLLCLWLEQQQQRVLSEQQLTQLHHKVMAFSREFTHPLRQLRRDFKQSKSDLHDYPSVRKKLLEAELLLEQQEQKLLLDVVEEIGVVEEDDSLQLSDNVLRYQAYLLKQAEIQTTDINSDLSKLNQYVNN